MPGGEQEGKKPRCEIGKKQHFNSQPVDFDFFDRERGQSQISDQSRVSLIRFLRPLTRLKLDRLFPSPFFSLDQKFFRVLLVCKESKPNQKKAEQWYPSTSNRPVIPRPTAAPAASGQALPRVPGEVHIAGPSHRTLDILPSVGSSSTRPRPHHTITITTTITRSPPPLYITHTTRELSQ